MTISLSMRWRETLLPGSTRSSTAIESINLERSVSTEVTRKEDVFIRLPHTYVRVKALGKTLEQLMIRSGKAGGSGKSLAQILLIPIAQSLSFRPLALGQKTTVELYNVTRLGQAIKKELLVGGHASSSTVHYVKLSTSKLALHLIFIDGEDCYTKNASSGGLVDLVISRLISTQLDVLVTGLNGIGLGSVINWIDWSTGTKSDALDINIDASITHTTSTATSTFTSLIPRPTSRHSIGPLGIARSVSAMSLGSPSVKRSASRASTTSSTTSSYDAPTASTLAKQRSKYTNPSTFQQPLARPSTRADNGRSGTVAFKEHPPTSIQRRSMTSLGVYPSSYRSSAYDIETQISVEDTPTMYHGDLRYITPKLTRLPRSRAVSFSRSDTGSSPALDTVKAGLRGSRSINYDLSTPLAKLPEAWRRGVSGNDSQLGKLVDAHHTQSDTGHEIGTSSSNTITTVPDSTTPNRSIMLAEEAYRYLTGDSA